MELTHQEIEELLGAYALDAVDDDERDVVKAHLVTCPRCRAEVADHREVAALLAHTGTGAPAGIWDRIVESLDGTDEAPAMRLEVVPRDDAGPPPERRADAGGAHESPADRRPPALVAPIRSGSMPRWAPALLAAAVVLVILGLLGGLALDGDDDGVQVAQAPTLEQVADDAHDDPDATLVDLTDTDGSVASQLIMLPEGAGFLDAGPMPVLAADKTYQLWGRTHNETISLGTFHGGAGVVPFQISSEVELFAVTVEEAGGVISSEQEPVMVGEVS